MFITNILQRETQLKNPQQNTNSFNNSIRNKHTERSSNAVSVFIFMAPTTDQRFQLVNNVPGLI